MNKQGCGLYSIHRGVSAHEGETYFIKGQQKITPLSISKIWVGLEDEDFANSLILQKRTSTVFDKAFRRHSGEFSDSLQQRIRHYFELSKN
ncbi:hypothetical protein [Hymenobacter guriensis]|uniref:hypothetical protein n=1 Tax=Hymenobacter guriensis TaxID=2793065 RepID=UPI0018C95DF9|nr:hypothetical protein [Hymenobacter guriensis]